MLDAIKKLEGELETMTETAKVEAAAKLQRARTEASDVRVNLEQSLRVKEAEMIREAEQKAEQEAAALIASAHSSATKPDQQKADTIAEAILKIYIA